MRVKHLMAFLIASIMTFSILAAFAMDGQQELGGQRHEEGVGSTIRPEIKTYIDELFVSEIVSIEHTTDSIEESKKRLPADPKVFSAGRYKAVFINNGDKKAVILQTEEKVGHVSPVMPGKTDVGGYVEILRNPESVQNEGALQNTQNAGQGKELSKIDDLKLNEPELDYLIRMLYKKFEKPLSDSQAMNLNDVKDYALAIKFSKKNGMIEYHNNLVRELR